MRPVERGPVPTRDNMPVEFSEYGDARDYLIQRLGDYCSYCETALHSSIDVEHVQPKSRQPELELTWGNFLLACTYCNSIKGDTPILLDDYFWPDVDNTSRVLDYAPMRSPVAVTRLSQSERAKAQQTIALTGLDREAGHPQLSKRDRRWQKRCDAWGQALLARKNILANDTDYMREQVILTALSLGFWSVWMAVFHDDVDMKRRLITAFTGTATDCFDDQGNAVRRPGRPV